MKLRVLVAGLVFGVAAFAADSGAELFQKAVTQERAAGNLEEAIKLYQRVAKEFASDRALAAKALVQEARCYEKLGQDKALKIYEQVARDYRDQREPSATASARLAVLRQGDRAAAAPATMTARKIELPGLTFGIPDGQRVVYTDDATGALMIGDLAGRDKRVVFKPKTGRVLGFMPSRDFSMVYMFLTRPDGSSTDAVIKSDGTGYRELGRFEGDSGLPGWSWDNRYVLVGDRLPDGSTRLLRITVADGQRLEMLRRENTIIGSASFSPDGRFIAYSEGPTGSSKVLVLPSQGGPPQLVSGDSTLVDWTRDGRYLAINSGSPDRRALYLLPVKDGQASGEPVFIRNGSIEYGMTTATGSLLYLSTPQVSGVSLGTLDPDGHLVSWKRLNLGGGSRYPYLSWSPDGSQIVYRALNTEGAQQTYVVHLRNVASGEDRELYRANNATPFCVWAAQHPSLYCGEIGYSSSTTQILSVAVDSGRVERLASLPGRVTVQSPSRDDSALYMSAGGKGLIKWEIATHQETLLGKGEEVSPDERWIRGYEGPREPPLDPALRYAIQLRPISGADWRRVSYLRTGPPPNGVAPTQHSFTPDGNWLYFHDRDSAGKDALFRASTAGGEPERMGDFPSHSIIGGMRISPDGRKTIVNAPDPNANLPELWLLENFEPKQQAAR